MKINVESTVLSLDEIKSLEEKKDAKYVCETSLKAGGDSYYENPVAVFYAKEVHPVSKSRYFGIFHDMSTGYMMICNAASVEDEVIQGVLTEDNEIIYSRFRHDYRKVGDVMIDGGRDYTRCIATSTIPLVVRNGKIQVQLEKVV